MEDRYGFLHHTDLLYIEIYKMFLAEEQKRTLTAKEKALKLLIAEMLKETKRYIKRWGLQEDYKEFFALFENNPKSRKRR